MDKAKVKEMLCKAIDNIPECAEIKDCYVEHGFLAPEAIIKVYIQVKNETDENAIEFHNLAHYSFNTDMGHIS